MSWGAESWHEAARDYRADRKLGRRHRIVNMDSERDVTDAAIISFGEHRDQLKEIRPPAFSDDALALRFIDQHKDTLRYVPSLGKWLRWDDKRWCFDDRLIAYDRMRRVCRAAAADCNQPKLAKLIASNKTAAAAERFARSDQRIIATVDEWDADPWLLNTPGGTVDLRTGEERSHNQSDLLTKITGVAPDASCPTPVWDAFLARSRATNPSYQRTCSGWPAIRSPARHKSTRCSSSTGSAPTARQRFSTLLRPAPATITARHRSRHSRPQPLIGTRPSSPACAARVSSPPSRQKKAAAGPRARSRRSPAATRFPRGSCGRTSSSSRRSSS